MKKVFLFLRENYGLLVFIPVILILTTGIEAWLTQNLILKICLLPVMILIIIGAYYDISNKEEDDLSFNRIRNMAFTVPPGGRMPPVTQMVDILTNVVDDRRL